MTPAVLRTRLLRLVLFCWACGVSTCALSASPAATPRTDALLSSGWRFVREETTGAENITFDDSTWSAVSVPHTWNAQDGQDGGNNYYRGPGWYRLHLPAVADLGTKSVFLKFEGAATVTDVFVNGTKLGDHRGNFGMFCFDITSQLHPGSGNLLAVRVTNEPQDDVAPQAGDFTIFGGIYRPVHLLVTAKQCISPLVFASSGIQLAQRNVNAAAADLDVSTTLRNAASAAVDLELRLSLRDAQQKQVATIGTKFRLEAGAKQEIAPHLKIPKPHLWNGVPDPYLYTVTAQLLRDGKLLDQVEQHIGFRSYRVDPKTGFWLNGKPYRLHGVNRHQDRLDKGWAISDADHRQDAQIIAELGCNAVRLAHYQHSQTFYDLCDQRGLIVWAELPLIDKMEPDNSALRVNLDQQLTELITQSFNHPSICFWSLFNELRVTKDKPIGFYAPAIRELNSLAKSMDPTRLTAAASCVPIDLPVNTIPDVIGFNTYPGWYFGQPADFAKYLDDLHSTYSAQCVGITEYGAGASIKQHEVPPSKPKAGGPWHPEEWQSLVHESDWTIASQRPWIWGTFVWNGFDFAADHRKEGDQPGRNDKGLSTYDRRVRKDAYSFYQANWTSAPMVAIASRRFIPRPAGETTVTVYSNCDQVELSLNDKSAGSQKPDAMHVLRWPVTLTSGTAQLHAVGKSAGKSASDEVTWTVGM